MRGVEGMLTKPQHSLEPQVYKHRISVSTHMPSQGLGFTVSLTAGTFELPQTRFSAPGPARPVQPSTAAGSIHTTSQVWPSRSSKARPRSEEHTSELQSREKLVCRLL